MRGFAVKFYTEEGNWDLVGNNIPVFFIQDAIKFPDLIHAVKPEPHNEIPQAATAHDTFWDFISLVARGAHMVMWIMSDRALPRSLRTMEGFGVHTFRLVNADGKTTLSSSTGSPAGRALGGLGRERRRSTGRIPTSTAATCGKRSSAATTRSGSSACRSSRGGRRSSSASTCSTRPSCIPEELVPVRTIGKMTLNRNTDNYFAETEQVAFCTANLVPGIDFTDDPLLQGGTSPTSTPS